MKPPTEMRPPSWAPRADAWFKLLGAIALGGLILSRVVRYLAEFADVTAIAAGGLFLAYLLYPAVRGLNRRLPLWAALAIVYTIFFVALGAALEFLVPAALDQVRALATNLPSFERTARDALLHPHGALTAIPPWLREYLAKLPGDTSIALQRNGAQVTSTLTAALFGIATAAALIVAIPVVSIYMLAESADFKRFVARAIPRRYEAGVLHVLSEIDEVVGGFIRGQLIVAGAVAVLSSIALFLLHVPYALLIGIWAGLADILPYVGPFAGGIPAFIVAFSANGWTNALYVAVAFTAINQIEAHLLAPRIVARTVRVTPLIVIFSLLVGAHLFGFIGLLLAVPAAGAVRVGIDHLFRRPAKTDAELKPGLTAEPRIDVIPDEPVVEVSAPAARPAQT